MVVTAPIKIKEVLLNEDLPYCRLKFDLKSKYEGRTVYGQVYKNGAPIGTLRDCDSTIYVTFSQDFSGWVEGDLIQIYGYYIGEATDTSVGNMLFYYDIKLTHLGGNELTTPLETPASKSMTNQDP